MKFILEETQDKSPVFGDVEIDQFFVNKFGELCQKITADTFVALTDEEGKPCAYYSHSVMPTQPIQRILPKVVRIEY